MANEIDRTPGLSDDGSDAFGDALDALTGYCRPEYQYKDPPNTTLPSEEEIAKLSRWARIAFAARCARRVLPLFRDGWPGASARHLRSSVDAVDLLEHVAQLTPNTMFAASEMSAALRSAAHGELQPPPGVLTSVASSHPATKAIIYAGFAAHETVIAAAGNGPEAAVPKSVVACADEAFHLAATHANIAPYICRDFDHLARLAEWQHWTDDTPVPPEVFGPLWPEGPPAGWPPITAIPARTELAIEAFARERETEQMIEDDVVNLFNALNRYHIARSGVRLTLEQVRSLLPASVPVEA